MVRKKFVMNTEDTPITRKFQGFRSSVPGARGKVQIYMYHNKISALVGLAVWWDNIHNNLCDMLEGDKYYGKNGRAE